MLAELQGLTLNDRTEIAGGTWADIKEEAMGDDYKGASWFVSLVYSHRRS